MDITVMTVRDQERGCGWRKPGGLYLVAPEAGIQCGRLPVPLDVCPSCGQGIKFSRSWTWIDPTRLATQNPCNLENCGGVLACPLSDKRLKERQRDGLIWIGKEHYPTVQSFVTEEHRLGISRRIKSVPRGFVPGETWVWLAHLEAVPRREGWTPGAFMIFLPRTVEYVTTGKETDEELSKLVDRGITPVKIERVGEQGNLLEALDRLEADL